MEPPNSPNDPEAAREADAELQRRHKDDTTFWTAHPDGKLTMRPEDATLRAEWLAIYKAALAKRANVGTSAPGCTAPCKPILAIKILRLQFTSDHALLTDYTTDWKMGGTRYHDKDIWEWTSAAAGPNPHSYPITHTMDQTINAIAEFKVDPSDATPAAGQAVGHGPSHEFTFSGGGQFAPDKSQVHVVSQAKLAKKVHKVSNVTLSWQATAEGHRYAAGSSGPHTIFVIMGTPVNQGQQEDGVTLKRMEKAVQLVGAVGSIDPHKIVHALMMKFPYYTLEQDDNIPEAFNHPRYFNDVGGAWPIADYISATAECQAICRFVRAIIHQVGCPGTVELVVVWADPDINAGAVALEQNWGAGGGLYGRSKTVGGKTWYATLVDVDPVAQGHEFERNQIGLNNFEACLKFSYAGVTKYYGGGAGVYNSAQEVIKAFQALCWVSYKTISPTHTTIVIEQIVKRY